MLGLAPLLVACWGCPITGRTGVPGRACQVIEHETQRPYYLYVPTSYTPDKKWPLVVTCHGTWPWDRDDRQIKEWQWFAERYRFIVAAPQLLGTKSIGKPRPDRQLEYQRADEELLLNVVRDLATRYGIDRNQVMLTGWSAGAYAVFYTGLRNPDTFRALAARMGNFDRRFLDLPEVTDRLDVKQKIFLFYGRRDLLRKEAVASAEWLRERGWDDDCLRVMEFDRSHESRPEAALRFFQKVLRSPHVTIRMDRIARREGMTVQFSCNAFPPAVKYLWQFGDGADSEEQAPVHQYEEPGRYRCRLLIRTQAGRTLVRERTIHVPLGPR